MTWDGDDLAGQMEEAVERQQAAAEVSQRVHLTPEQRAKQAERESLRLSLSRIQSQLSRATNPAHRAMLESAQESINSKLVALGSG